MLILSRLYYDSRASLCHLFEEAGRRFTGWRKTQILILWYNKGQWESYPYIYHEHHSNSIFHSLHNDASLFPFLLVFFLVYFCTVLLLNLLFVLMLNLFSYFFWSIHSWYKFSPIHLSLWVGQYCSWKFCIYV